MTSPSLYRRPLPEGLVAFSSREGRALFREALAAGTLEGWFPLAEQFHTQSEPAFCGLGTLVIVLNALAIDPGRPWPGARGAPSAAGSARRANDGGAAARRPGRAGSAPPATSELDASSQRSPEIPAWRWFGEELLDCCQSLDVVREKGLTLAQIVCLARCNGAAAEPRRAGEDPSATEDALRAAVRLAATTPDEPHLVAAYARGALGQTGSGHYSPIAGYHAEKDLVLLLDVARFKYPPHWVPLPRLYDAMRPRDPATGRARGWIELRRGEHPPIAEALKAARDVLPAELDERIAEMVAYCRSEGVR